jgi:hypothetical protein
MTRRLRRVRSRDKEFWTIFVRISFSRARLLNVVHGVYQSTAGLQRGTLIVMGFKFLGNILYHRFHKAIINIIFALLGCRGQSGPEDINMAPNGHFAISRTGIDFERDRNSLVDVQIEPATGLCLGWGVGSKVAEKVEKTDRVSLNGIIRVERTSMPVCRDAARF